MHRSTPESVAFLQPVEEPAHFGERDVLGAPANFADDVMVFGFFHQVDHSRTMAKVNVVKMARVFQGLNGSIDRRLIYGFAELGFGPGPEVGRGEVLVMRCRQHPTDGPPGCSYA